MSYKKIYCKDCKKLLNKYAYRNNTKRCSSCAKKGKNNPMYNFEFSLEHRNKISDALKGRKFNQEWRDKIRKYRIGKKASLMTKNKMSTAHINRYKNYKEREKMSIATKNAFKDPKIREKRRLFNIERYKDPKERIKMARFGDKNSNWRGGITNSPYNINFNKIHKEFIRKRDNHKCQLCGVPQLECYRKLDVHHIDYDKMNTNPKNNISLCNICNLKVNGKREYWEKYFKNLINKKYKYIKDKNESSYFDSLCRAKKQ